jgi:hypothetical protein
MIMSKTMTDGNVNVLKVISETMMVFVLETVISLVMLNYTLVKMMLTNVVVTKDILKVYTKLLIKFMVLNVEEIVTGLICKNMLLGVKMVLIIILVLVCLIGTTILWVKNTLKE